MDFSTNIKGYLLEYIDDTHTYLVDGVIVPSITQLLKPKFGKKYEFVNNRVLAEAAKKGTYVHQCIEDYCKLGTDVDDCKELQNFKFLKKQYGFDVIDNEVPVILFDNEEPISAGRMDLVLKIGDDVGIGDIKRTSALDKEYLTYQLNLYRLAYQQCYDTEINFLKGLHLREDTRKFVNIPIKENILDFVKEF